MMMVMVMVVMVMVMVFMMITVMFMFMLMFVIVIIIIISMLTFYCLYPCRRSGHLVEVKGMGVDDSVKVHIPIVARDNLSLRLKCFDDFLDSFQLQG